MTSDKGDRNHAEYTSITEQEIQETLARTLSKEYYTSTLTYVRKLAEAEDKCEAAKGYAHELKKLRIIAERAGIPIRDIEPPACYSRRKNLEAMAGQNTSARSE